MLTVRVILHLDGFKIEEEGKNTVFQNTGISKKVLIKVLKNNRLPNLGRQLKGFLSLKNAKASYNGLIKRC